MEATNDLHVILGTGPLGIATMNELLRQGKRVRMVNRKGSLEEALPEVEVVKGDISDLSSAAQLCKGASAVYICASPPYRIKEWTEKWPPIIAGSIEGAASAGAKLVFGDNVYSYGDTHGQPQTEDMPTTAQTRKGKLRASMQQTLMAAHRSGKVQVAIGRGSDFYGPGVLNSLLGERVFYPALAGKSASATGKIDYPHTYTYIKDFGIGLAILGTHDEAMGQIWHVPNAPAISTRQVISMIYEETGQPVKISTLGTNMMRIAGLFLPEAGEVVELMYEFNQPFIVDSSKFEKTFGIHATPIREGLKETLAWYKAHPKSSR